VTRPAAAALFLAVLLAGPATGQSLVTGALSRTGLTLDGDWRTIVDPYENGYYTYRYTPRSDGFFQDRHPASRDELVEYDFDTSDILHVPGDWNSQSERLFLYEGTVWYRRLFDLVPETGRRYVLHFGAANYEAIVFLNGEEVGRHTGGFTPFEFEVTGLVRGGSNSLVVKVDSRRTNAGVPTVNTDWWNYGGLTRDVRMLDLPSTFVRDYVVQLDPDDPRRVLASVVLDGDRPAQDVVVRLPGYGIERTFRTDAGGAGSVSIPVSVRRWSPESPELTEVRIEAETDAVSEEVGFRTIEVRGRDILLNGEPVFLRGISLHEVAPLREGRATTDEDAEVLLGWARELGCNFVRLAHYPHSEHMVRAADRLGLMVWSEIPVYWTIQWDNPDTYALAEQQLSEMILRDRNRASIVIWSVGNETPRGESRQRFMTGLVDRARSLDPTRLVSAATELSYDGKTLIVDDPLGESLDVLGLNEYIGWYSDLPQNIGSYTLRTPYDKPVIITEFGGGAKAGLHGEAGERWTEEFQAEIYRNQTAMLDAVPFVRGMTPWILTDFRSPRRPLPVIQDFWNRKGLISEHGERKMAFHVLRDYYGRKAAEDR